MEKDTKRLTNVDLLRKVLKKGWIILIFGLVFGGISYYVNKYQVQRVYQAETTIFIGREAGNIAEFNFFDIQVGQQLINDYKELVKTETVRRGVVESLNLQINPDKLTNKIKVRIIQNSRFMIIQVLDKDPQVAAFLANSFASVLIEKAETIIGAKKIQVVDLAYPDFDPIRPNVASATVILCFVGILFGLGVTLILILLDNKITDYNTIKEIADIPFLGQTLPVNASKDNGLVMLKSENTYAEELYKIIRTNLEFTKYENDKKVLLFTSPKSSEGKTTTISNIAISLAQVGKKVLLIDADLRKPKIHEIFSISNEKGLVNVLLNEDVLSEAIIPHEIKGLSIMPSGPIPPNPSELLLSQSFEVLLKGLNEYYDLILIDSPPVLPVADALILTKHVGKVVEILAYNETKKEEFLTSVQSLERVGSKISGVIITKAKVKKKRYYYYQKNARK